MSTILLRDDFRPPTGRLSYKVFRKGTLVEQFDDHNLIVVGSQATHAHLLGGDTANRSLAQIGFGTNATTEQFANTSLTNAYANNLQAPTYPAPNQVSFGFALGAADSAAFGMAISEFGLFTAGGTLYARRTRTTPINFASDISLSGTWVISF